MSPYRYIYFDAYQRVTSMSHSWPFPQKRLHYEPQPSHCAPSSKSSSLVHWCYGRNIKTPRHAEYMVFPRLSALAETLWSAKADKSWSEYSQQRLPKLMQRYQKMHINAATSAYNPTISSAIKGEQLQVSMRTDIEGTEIYYTLDDSEPTLTSLRYQQPIIISERTRVRARSFAKPLGQLVGDAQLTLAPHLALGKEISFSYPPAEGSATKLQDGQFAYDQFYSVNDYAIFYDSDLEAVIDLDSSTLVERVEIGYNSGRHRQLHPPTSIKIWGSKDNKNWQPLAHIQQPPGPMSILSFAATRVRYLKMVPSIVSNLGIYKSPNCLYTLMK